MGLVPLNRQKNNSYRKKTFMTEKNSSRLPLSPYVEGLRDFIRTSPTAFHAADSIRRALLSEGFTELSEADRWDLKRGGKYFSMRHGSSIIAFRIGHELEGYGFMIAASHSDSPCFKLKENEEIRGGGNCLQLNTEGYGGMICPSWMDRPLSVAGRVLIREKDEDGSDVYRQKLIDLDRDLVLIPNVSIHMNRQINDGYAYNKQVDMLPLFGESDTPDGTFLRMAAEAAGADPEAVMGSDLYLYNRTPSSIWGANEEFFSSSRIDDLECAYTTLQGFLEGGCDMGIQVYACFDNEEVGSVTGQGAASTFFKNVLYRAAQAMGMDDEGYCCMTARSFMLSCDNAHAVHPNHPEKTDKTNCASMNGGIVIKSHAGQKYTSGGLSIALFKGICEKAGVPVQYFSNRSDMMGGSTLGNIAMRQVSMPTVDIGLAQLAMHSAYETTGIRDIDHMIRACRQFFKSAVTLTGDGTTIVRS